MFNVVSLFSGCGGLDLGFKQAGFEILFANDFNKDAVETYKKNIGNEIVLGDITKINEDDLPKNVDVLLGGFPCQGFSLANVKRSIDDSRNYLYKQMFRIAKIINPKIIVAENVSGIITLAGGLIFKEILKELEDLGYLVEWKLVDTAFFGVPQHRKRVIIIANRIGEKNLFAKETHTKNNFVTTKDAIQDLKDLQASTKPIHLNNKIIYNHCAYTNVESYYYARKNKLNKKDVCDYLKYWLKNSGLSIKKIDKSLGYKHTAGHWFRRDVKSCSIPKPDDWWKLKELLNFDNKYDQQVTEFVKKPKTYRQDLAISNWDAPSNTILATNSFIHTNKKRRLSVRECARIQTFPDDFVFYGSLSSMHRQIGNAVPVKFSKLTALKCKEILENNTRKGD